MDQQSSNRTKSWLYRLRYLKMWKHSNNATTDISQIHESNSDYHERTNITVFQRSFTTSSLNEAASHIKKNEHSLRKSLRKWHMRMKNCFSKNSIHSSQRQATHMVHTPASPNLSRRSFSTPTSQKENIYCLDPFLLQRKFRSPAASDQTSTNSTLTPSPENQSPSDHIETGYIPKNEVSSLAHCVWYWGPASKSQVEAKLAGAPDGSFLVRDSASDRHIFSISFRSVGLTLHARIEYTNSGYKLFDHEGYDTVKELIEQAIEESEKGLLCYTYAKNRSEVPNYPVRLLKPISRYDEVRSLQSLSRFVIRQHINLNDIDKLCLPATLISFLKEENYFS